MEKANCYFCRNARRYKGITYCVYNPKKPVMMSSHPSTCDECKSISEGKGNFTFKMNKDQKAYVDSDLKFIPGHCKEGCLFYLEHLNYCAAFDFICSQDGYAPECFYNNLNEDKDEK